MFGNDSENDDLAPAGDIFYPAQRRIETVCVFGGARPGRDPRLTQAATALGECIAEAGIRLVYGGGSDGLMGAVAVGAVRKGGDVMAVAPRFLADRMRLLIGCQTIIVPDMGIRKQLMFDYADAFIAMPGGIGTIEELSEVMTHRKLERHCKPVLLANFGSFWDPWLAMLAHLGAEGFLTGNADCAQLVSDSPDGVLPMLQRGMQFSPGAMAPQADLFRVAIR